jgi:hypothetical protein
MNYSNTITYACPSTFTVAQKTLHIAAASERFTRKWEKREHCGARPTQVAARHTAESSH